MENLLPNNQDLLDYSVALPWQTIEENRLKFNAALAYLSATHKEGDALPLEALSDRVGVSVESYYDPANTDGGNILLANENGRRYILGAVVSARYRSGKPVLESVTPYNLNPAVNHHNIEETDDHSERMRALGAELELGLVHHNGDAPTEDEMQEYMARYAENAQRIGIYPRLDREACQYQIEAHIAPNIGYVKTRQALAGVLTALAASSEQTGLRTAIMSAYPTLSDFKMSESPKVQTAIDLMLDVNADYPEYAENLSAARERYHTDPENSHYVQMFRNQGCHIHLDLAGRSEALGLLTFYTMLRSTSAIANAAVLKGGPFVNGTCDAELLCVREHLRSVTVTGRFLDIPLNPHFSDDELGKYANLLRSERANAMARGLLYNEDTAGNPLSVMHNPIGRVRPDLGTSKRVCTVESTGMPTNISASRTAAVLTDFELNHTLIEHYFRKHGCDLEPMYNDKTFWAVLGPLSREAYQAQQDLSDRECTDAVITTATGESMTLVEFYEMKRLFMHKALSDVPGIMPRDIDDVYTSLKRMLEPPSGLSAQTVAQYISDPKLKSTGNWGRILRNAFIEAGGTPGQHNPDAVLKVVQQIHEALKVRYL